jgi:hypothetical protein
MDKSLIEASFEFVYSISGCFFYFMNEKYFQYLNCTLVISSIQQSTVYHVTV